MVTVACDPIALESIWRWLGAVLDPEVPAVSVVDLGIVRGVAWKNEDGQSLLEVTITPTYTGCPATAVIKGDIVRALHDRGVPNVRILTRLDPPWTTDWLSHSAREKLRAYGIAPPAGKAADNDISILVRTAGRAVTCPRCSSPETTRISEFGSTPCKALYRCNACREPFDHFKCH